MVDQRDTIQAVQVQRKKALRTLSSQNRWTMKPASTAFAILGLAVVVLWFVTNDDTTMSALLFLAGVSILAIAILMFYFTPNRYLRNEVYEAMCRTDVLSMRKILSSLLITSRGISVPAKLAGSSTLFIPVADKGEYPELSRTGSSLFFTAGNRVDGLVIDPPGKGLFLYAQSIGAFFTPEGLENEIKDVLENSLELAAKVGVSVAADKVTVAMSDIACRGLCEAVRRENPAVCSQTGCPVCSLVGCMVADGMGRAVRVDDVSVDGRTIRLTLELLGEP